MHEPKIFAPHRTFGTVATQLTVIALKGTILSTVLSISALDGLTNILNNQCECLVFVHPVGMTYSVTLIVCLFLVSQNGGSFPSGPAKLTSL